MTTSEIQNTIDQMEAQGIYVEGIKSLLHDAQGGKKNTEWYLKATIQSIAEAKEEYERISKINLNRIARKKIKTLATFSRNHGDCGKVLRQISQNAPEVFTARIKEAREMLQAASWSRERNNIETSVTQLKEAAKLIAALKKDIAEYNPEPSNDGPGFGEKHNHNINTMTKEQQAEQAELDRRQAALDEWRDNELREQIKWLTVKQHGLPESKVEEIADKVWFGWDADRLVYNNDYYADDLPKGFFQQLAELYMEEIEPKDRELPEHREDDFEAFYAEFIEREAQTA